MKKLDISKKGFVEVNASSKALNTALNYILFLSVIISIAFFSFSYFFIDVQVVGPSMQPTVNAQWTTEDNYKQDTAYIKKSNNYNKGDIIVAQSTGDLYVIKRLIAIEGDRVNIVENLISGEIELYLNNELLVEDYVVYKDGMSYTLNNFNNLRSTMPENFVEDDLIIPENYVFYLGDNRGQSQDCSYYGPIEKEKVIGKVDIIVPYGQTFVGFMWQEFISLFN
ncbi:MAG: signal peptidase I [Clostridia bacterium]|nr:signal peptidase I [Clostridia bacterium]